ncbi:hypothetical protein MADA3029_1230357 [Vibrio nigripulchritudo MADA3029]|nr:hypothetical protein VIBNIMADA3020_580001 [Vibrio nigripulchritudo MADA3020]CCN54774.1 hypothetical protein VIBNIMADA3021_610001 [Vibrio nigripulchritudo MADA3021]CCN58351.1 hypothetical protein MADA3029_1230357 [Vibrio nigripulchritudo MADA3029]
MGIQIISPELDASVLKGSDV